MYTIGSDPEFFVIKGQYYTIPAFEIIAASKDKPANLKNGYKVFHDNVTVEGNIPPAKSKEEFITNMRTIKVKINKLLSPFNCRILESSSETFSAKQLEDKRANEFGCMPYMNAWTFQEEIPAEITNIYRTAG